MKRHVSFDDQMYLYLKDCKLVNELRHYSTEPGDLGVHSATMLALISPNIFRTSHPDMQSLRALAALIKEKAGEAVMQEINACTECGKRQECCAYLAFEDR